MFLNKCSILKKLAAATMLLVLGREVSAQETGGAAPIQHYKRIVVPGTPSKPSAATVPVGPRATSPKFVPIFDASINSHPRAADIQATINAALQVYSDKFTDPVTVTIFFKNINSGLGQSSTANFSFTYAEFRAALAAKATSADDMAAIATIPATTNNPVTNDPMVQMSAPLARVLGLNGAVDATDSTVSLNMSEMNLTAADTDKGKYSLFATVLHEVDEVLGIGSSLDDAKNAPLPITGPISPEDLFRYEKTGGVRSYTNVKTAESFFSIDGKTNLAQFNQDKSGDFADWYSPGGQVPQVQDAFGTPGTTETLGVELRVLDVLGWTLLTSTTGGGGGTPGVNTPPVIGSIAAANPNPASAGQPTTLIVGATDADNDTLTVDWDFGDKTKGTGASTTHIYAATGTYTAVASVTDGKGGLVNSTVVVNVIVPVIKATVVKAKFSLNFKSGSDGIDVTMGADAFAALKDDSVITVVIGDPGTTDFDSASLFKNKGTGSIGKFAVSTRNGTLRFVASKTSLQSILLPFGAENKDTSETVTVPFYFRIDGSYYGDKIDFSYNAKEGKTGTGK